MGRKFVGKPQGLSPISRFIALRIAAYGIRP
jgi:hypothetical protein